MHIFLKNAFSHFFEGRNLADIYKMFTFKIRKNAMFTNCLHLEWGDFVSHF